MSQVDNYFVLQNELLKIFCYICESANISTLKMAIITRKIELHIHHDKELDLEKEIYNSHWNYWHQINDNLYTAANRVASHLFFNDEIENRIRIKNKRFKEIEKLLKTAKGKKLSVEEVSDLKSERATLFAEFRQERKDFLGASEQNSTYKVVSNEFLGVIPSEILTNLNQNISSTYKEYRKDITRGVRTLPNFKRGLPVPFSMTVNNVLKIKRRDDGTIYLSWINGIEWDLNFGRDRSNNRDIVENILLGKYKACNSSIQQKDRGKVFLLLVVDIPQQDNNLDSDRVVGVDLGINIPLYAALNDNSYGGVAIGSREQFLKVRERMYARKRELQRSLRNSTAGGHGRKQKLQALEQFDVKERNWVRLQNHIFSKEVVEYAKRSGAGVIQMENLSGFGKDRNDNIEQGFRYIVRYWSYFELQSMIENKAKFAGIEVRYINPYHTSQRCSFCGSEEKGQRLSQSKFVCKNADCTKGKGRQNSKGEYEGINADWNAARNIAMSENFMAKGSKKIKK